MFVKKQDFFETPLGIEIEAMIRLIDSSDEYITVSSYSPNTSLYEGNSMTFVEKHMAYLRSHPKVDPLSYISNLKLMSRKRG